MLKTEHGISFEVNAQPFEAAMAEYARFDKRELPDILNAKLGEWALCAARNAPTGNRAAIYGLKEGIRGGPKAFWKLVQSIYNAGWKIKGRRKSTEEEKKQYYRDVSTREKIYGRKTVSYWRNTGLDLHKKGDLNRVAKQFIRRRAAKVKAMIAMFLETAHMLGKTAYGIEGGKGVRARKLEGIMVKWAMPVGMKAEASFSIPWRASTIENKQHEGDRESRSIQKANIALSAVTRARDIVVSDMRKKTAERYARGAAVVSHKGINPWSF